MCLALLADSSGGDELQESATSGVHVGPDWEGGSLASRPKRNTEEEKKEKKRKKNGKTGRTPDTTSKRLFLTRPSSSFSFFFWTRAKLTLIFFLRLTN